MLTFARSSEKSERNKEIVFILKLVSVTLKNVVQQDGMHALKKRCVANWFGATKLESALYMGSPIKQQQKKTKAVV